MEDKSEPSQIRTNHIYDLQERMPALNVQHCTYSSLHRSQISWPSPGPTTHLEHTYPSETQTTGYQVQAIALASRVVTPSYL